ncbi:MAG: hypothetical protein ACXWL5_04210 [Candidatus Chromulinivorax sp.]
MDKKNIVIIVLSVLVLLQFGGIYYYRQQLCNISIVAIEELVPQKNDVAIQSVQEEKSSSSSQTTQKSQPPIVDEQLIKDFVQSINSMKKYMKEHNGKEFKKAAQDGKNILQKIKEQGKNHKMTKSQYAQFDTSVKELHQMRIALDKAKAARLSKENKSSSSSSSLEKNK